MLPQRSNSVLIKPNVKPYGRTAQCILGFSSLEKLPATEDVLFVDMKQTKTVAPTTTTIPIAAAISIGSSSEGSILKSGLEYVIEQGEVDFAVAQMSRVGTSSSRVGKS